MVKLTDRSLADPRVLAERMQAVEAGARALPFVVPPMRINGQLIQTIGGWFMTATPFVDGDRLDITKPAGAYRLGESLAQLHEVLAGLPAYDIPPVAALDAPVANTDRSRWQLLHGDFSDQNVIETPAGLQILDFDDCGYGPVEYDLANSLYMVLFDSEVSDRRESYETFRPAFVEGYADAAQARLVDSALDRLIEARINALGRWLDDLSTAPIGIRTSSPEWLRTLQSFVRSHGSTGRE